MKNQSLFFKIIFFTVLISITTKESFSQSWNVTGNSITSSNFIGTTNVNALVFKVNNTQMASIGTNYNISFQNSTASGIYSVAMGSGSSATGGVSFAQGSSDIASGSTSFAAGYQNSATNNTSFAMGNVSLSNGYVSFALGNQVTSSAMGSFATGYNTTANGAVSFAMGDSTIAPSYAELSIGSYNTKYTALNTTGYNAADRVFSIGIGTSGARKTALTVLKNGKMGLGTTTPTEILDVVGNVKFSGAIMPNNLPGTAGQVLTSGGAGTTPTWTTPTLLTPGTSGYVLTSTGTGTTWAAATVAFSGTTNYISKFTPSGTAIGSSEIYDNGTFVGLNTTTAPTGYLFAVNGKAIFNKIVVEAYGNWADFVFQNNYKLPAITDVAKYINQYQHLPGVPSESEVEKNGIDVGENQKILLQKVEELTLYIIDQNKQIEAQNKETAEQNKKIEELQNQNEQLQELKKEVDDLKVALLQKTK